MASGRPTLRCLREDLGLPVPPLTEPLNEVRHPLVRKLHEQFADRATPHERIAAIDDNTLFKVKVQRWRGAAWLDGPTPWLVAAGWREADSVDDFYAALAVEGRAARARYNANHRPSLTTQTHTAGLLPDVDDRRRLAAERGTRFVRSIERAVSALVRESLCDGHEHLVEMTGCVIGVQVRADDGHETYVAVRISGPVPDALVPIILDAVPGCDRDGWYPEVCMPERTLVGNEQAWSNIMDTAVAAKLLEGD